MITSVDEARLALAELLGRSRRAVAFTGAGISTECGVPDFRSADSPWRRYPPIDFKEFLSDPAMRVEAWRRKFTMDDLYAGAGPGRTHRSLAYLAAARKIEAVITQNIDGLHQEAGLPEAQLIELHGNGTYATCLSCGRRHELGPIRVRFDTTGEAPSCGCGGMVKSATVAFGQALSPDRLARAKEHALGCDLFLALGSSLVVQPAATLPVLARRKGAVLVIINREPTRLDEEADLLVRADVGVVMQPWAGAA